MGEIAPRDRCLSNRNLDPDLARVGLRFDPRISAPKEDEQTSLGPCILHRDSYQLLDQPGKDHLARNRLRGFDYSLDIQLRDRPPSRGRRGKSSFLAQARVTFVQLLHLAEGAPTLVAIPGFAQVRVRELVEASCGLESGSNLVANRLIVDESVSLRGADGPFIKAFGIDHAPF